MSNQEDRFSVEITLKVKKASGEDFSSVTLQYNDMSYPSLVKVEEVGLNLIQNLHKLSVDAAG